MLIYKKVCSPFAGPSSISPSAVSEARAGKMRTRARWDCALSIQRLEGGRWRLRRMRANGWTGEMAMGIESFFVCSLLILHGLGKSEKSGNRS
jgi:hypothetical protein